MSLDWIEPDWPAPPRVRSATTLRRGGVSQGGYESLNLGAHVGDAEGCVAENRRRLAVELNLPDEPAWLEQVHGHRVIAVDSAAPGRVADAAWTARSGRVCVVMTADCLPILLCDRRGTAVAAVHAGWRGLLSGVVSSTLKDMDRPGLMAWLGPAIGPEAFEVGDEVRQAFQRQCPAALDAFRPHGQERWLADIYELGRIILRQNGVDELYGGGWSTHGQPEEFFSYRRDSVTGRMATLIWMD